MASNIPTASYQTAYRDVRCYIERKPFPVVSVYGVYGDNVQASIVAQIVVAEDPCFEDRTYVEFEIVDSTREGYDPNFLAGKLLFEGEIRSYNVINTPQGVQCILTGTGSMDYQTVALVMSGSQKTRELPTGIAAQFSGASILKDNKELQRVLLTPLKDNAAPGVPGGLIHLLDVGMHGSSKGASFFRSANERLKLTQCMGAAPDDKTTEIFLMLKETQKFLEDVINGASEGGMPSVAALKSSLLSRVFYRSISVGPGYLAKKRTINYRTYTQTTAFSGVNTHLKDIVDKCSKIVATSGGTPGTAFGATPESSLLYFPGELINQVWVDIEKYQADMNFARMDGEQADYWSRVKAAVVEGRTYLKQIQESTGALYGEDTQNNQQSMPAQELDEAAFVLGESEMAAFGKTVTLPDYIAKKLNAEAGKKEGAPWQVVDSVASNTVIVKRRKLIQMYVETLKSALKDLDKAKESYVKKSVSGVAPERYHGEVLLPELFFAVPPACNMIVPSMYSEINISRNMAAEPTRLLLLCPSKSNEGRYYRKHSMSYVVAPNIAAVTGSAGGAKPLILEDALFGKEVVLPHERFSGPKPLIMPISGALGFEVNDVGELTRLAKALKKVHNSPSGLDILQEIAHFRFFDMQLGARQGSVTCHKWLDLLPGLPSGIVISTPASGPYGSGDHVYTARVGQIQYTINQDRTTSATVALSHIMGVGERESYMIHRRYYTQAAANVSGAKDYIVAAQKEGMADATFSQDLYGRALALAQKEIDKFKDDDAKSGAQAALDNTSIVLSAEIANTQMTQQVIATSNTWASSIYPALSEAAGKALMEGGSLPAGEIGVAAEGPPVYNDKWHNGLKEASDELFARLKDLSGGKLVVTEGKPVQAAYDDLMTPSWLDKCFSKAEIGKVYEYLFGTSSMLDHLKGVAASASVGEIVSAFVGMYGAVPDAQQRRITEMSEFIRFRPDAGGKRFVATQHENPVDPRGDRYTIVERAHLRASGLQFYQDAGTAQIPKGVDDKDIA